MEITEVIDLVDNEIILKPLYSFVEKGETNGKIIGELEKVNELSYKEKLNRTGIMV